MKVHLMASQLNHLNKGKFYFMPHVIDDWQKDQGQFSAKKGPQAPSHMQSWSHRPIYEIMMGQTSQFDAYFETQVVHQCEIQRQCLWVCFLEVIRQLIHVFYYKTYIADQYIRAYLLPEEGNTNLDTRIYIRIEKIYEMMDSFTSFTSFQKITIYGFGCSIEITNKQQKEDFHMGCNESLALQAEQSMPAIKQYASITPITYQDGTFDVPTARNPHTKASKETGTHAGDISMISKENSLMSNDDEQNGGSIKVKKAKRYKVRPEHEKFIEDIMESNRTKAITEFPGTLNKSSFAPNKPASISLHHKVQQSVSFDKENMEGHKQKHQKSVLNPTSQAKYSKKQAQKLMNNILQGKLNEQQLNKIGERIDLEQMDSNATLRL